METQIVAKKKITQQESVLYTGRTHTTGGRDGGSQGPLMDVLTSSFRCRGHQATAPILSSCLQLGGLHVSLGQ